MVILQLARPAHDRRGSLSISGPTSRNGFSYLPSWDDDRVSWKKRDPRVVAFQRLLVIERYLLLLTAYRPQNVDVLRTGELRQPSRRDNCLQRSHPRGHHDRANLANLANQKDPLAVYAEDHDRNHGILDVLFEPLRDICR